MEYKTITLTPGTIIVWKDYSKLKKWWYKLRNKELDWNTYTIACKKTDWVLNDKQLELFRIFHPKKSYNRDETLECLIYAHYPMYHNDFHSVISICNKIRPNTFEFISKGHISYLENSKYYTEVDATKKNK